MCSVWSFTPLFFVANLIHHRIQYKTVIVLLSQNLAFPSWHMNPIHHSLPQLTHFYSGIWADYFGNLEFIEEVIGQNSPQPHTSIYFFFFFSFFFKCEYASQFKHASTNFTDPEVNDHISLQWPWGLWDSNW